MIGNYFTRCPLSKELLKNFRRPKLGAIFFIVLSNESCVFGAKTTQNRKSKSLRISEKVSEREREKRQRDKDPKRENNPKLPL